MLTKQFRIFAIALTIVSFNFNNFLTPQVLADCLACWQLYGVTITMRDGQILEGHIVWNHSWYQTNEKDFPRNILKLENRMKELKYYYDIQSIKYPIEGLKVSAGPIKMLPLRNIAKIELRKSIHDGYGGAGDIPEVRKRWVKALQTRKPVTIYETSGGLSDIFFLSYNKAITKEVWENALKSPFGPIIESSNELEKIQIIKLVFPFD